MSDAIKIASQVPKLVEGMLADMFAANADDNRVCMGNCRSCRAVRRSTLVLITNLEYQLANLRCTEPLPF